MFLDCNGYDPILKVAQVGNPTGRPEETRPLEDEDPNSSNKDRRLQYEAARVVANLCNYDAGAKLVLDTGGSTVLELLCQSDFATLKTEGNAALAILKSRGLLNVIT